MLTAAQQDIASTIISMERAALDRSDKGDPQGFVEISARDVTYFDPFLDQPIHGLEALRAYYGNFTVPEGASGEMRNTDVQVARDVAVLTFNYMMKAPNGPLIDWNTTEVYRRDPEGWRIIHTHWSFLKPQLAQPEG
jgi:ketosteroid isomerase-like protein